MNENDFFRQQQAAVERMREMNARSAYYTNRSRSQKAENSHQESKSQQPRGQYSKPEQNQPQQSTPQSKPQENKPISNKSSFLDGLGIPFLDNLTKDGDSSLILGLLLILISENTDKMLLFALIYILL